MVKLTLETRDAYTVQEARAKLDIGYATIYRWIKSGKLSTLSIAGKTLVPKSEVQRLKHPFIVNELNIPHKIRRKK
jgi:excisionase family DNA binding protein